MSTTSRAAWSGLSVLAVLAAQALNVHPVAAAGPPVVDRSGWQDFNGDGFDDVAIGIPGQTVTGQKEAGAVIVLYGSSTGLTSSGAQLIRQGVAGGVPGIPEASDHFGWSVASGDLDGDGYADLAIGVPGEDLVVQGTNIQDVGVVEILHGSPTGLHASEPNIIEGVDRSDGAGSQFGSALAIDELLSPRKSSGVGIDGLADLAVGAPGAAIVHVFSGQRFTAAADQVVVRDIKGDAESRFGASLATGAFESGKLQLAIGAPAANNGAGAVVIERWPATQILQQGDGTIEGVPESGDAFGNSLAAGDLNGDGWDELAIGVPREDVGDVADAGVYQVLWSTGAGSLGIAPLYDEETGSGAVEAGDQFGVSVAIGGIGPKGAAALAVGAPFEDFGPVGVGTVGVFQRTSGTSMSGSFLFQGVGNVDGTREGADHFGWALSIGKFDAGTTGDLVIGVPHEGVGSKPAAGAVQVLYGGKTGADGTKEQLWSKDSSGVPGGPQSGDRFGADVR